MRRTRLAALLVLIFALPAWALDGRVTQDFDAGWRFLKGDAKGAEQPGFRDEAWRSLAVPHDWSIEGPYDQAAPAGRGGGYLPTGIGWYRKRFTVPKDEAGRSVRIEFDGIMANAEVWINGKRLGQRPYGYSSYSYDLTPHLKVGGANVLAVRVDNSVQPASRYYTGAGIYRHVRLVSTAPQFLQSVFIATQSVTNETATLRVQADAGKADASISTSIYDPSGKEVARHTGAASTFELNIPAPQRWGLSSPRLYRAVTQLRKDGKLLDEQTTRFGIRSARFDADTGFWLNDENIKLYGVCLHHDGGAVGAAVPLDVWRYRLGKLKEAGVNAIRTSHNPVAPEFLDLADEMGFLVMDETFDTWTAAKQFGEQGYNRFFSQWWEADTRSMVVRDRNHPSIVLYSVGNEIHDDLNSPEGFRKYAQQQDLIHQLDPTRPVTMGLFRPALSKVYENGFADTMDIIGQNYRPKELIAVHQAKPTRKVIGTENDHSLEQWLALRDNPFYAGQFLWTGFAYLGEADWPATTWNNALFNRIGSWTHFGLQRQSWWSRQPVVHIVRRDGNAGAGNWVADWTPRDPDSYDEAQVAVYSNAEEVELFLNDKSLGVKKKPANDAPRIWTTAYAAGALRAEARNGGRAVASETLRTAGAPASIALTTTRQRLGTSFDDAALVEVRVLDAQGTLVPVGSLPISFKLDGAGRIAAVDNGDANSHASYQAPQCASYAGRCLAIVKATAAKGRLVFTASAPNLPSATLTLSTE
ncbi:glycoside hydrolase family 2 TIM barrel-domain containing protein [Massilia sp. TS11]|uniref:glycoside hydrolase family 2 TIM barrel-domain containing protein n=1 Tax=Massilia sp. TS11 TaxID=2908003 RepID=UPI001EDBBB63|nr:glycoside hydrolase family 2 TIM barrel-domain containing protein [Massilia sp. TS11]MCG2583948.1 DUF4982 domain-containing protein [Massilia sp. TS11]